LSYGLAGQVQRIGKKAGIWGVQAGYEVLRSRVQVTNFFGRGSDVGVSVDGHTALANHFVNLHPYLGNRFSFKAFNLDLSAGPEVGWLHRSHEKGEAEGSGISAQTDLNRSHPDVDVRARVNLAASYKRTSLLVGYSYGLTSYRKNFDGGSNDLYLQVFRLGLAYRI
jgi:hypothetical protein